MAKRAVNNHGDPAICMVVGCGRKALYRNAGSARTGNTQRGYCSAHRAMAVRNQADVLKHQQGTYYRVFIEGKREDNDGY